MKPYIISHMMTSIDGRIDCPMLEHLSDNEYYIALEKLGKCSKLSGRVTAALECTAVKKDTKPIAGNPIGKESYFIAQESDEYTIVVDTYGKLNWQSNKADGHPILCIVSEQVSEDYLDVLRKQGISFIVTGEKSINLVQAMEILEEQFGIERLAIVGGGHINGGFLEAGLIDEVSLMVAPGIDGRAGQTAVFDGLSRQDSTPYHLELKSVEQWSTGIVWIRYKINRI